MSRHFDQNTSAVVCAGRCCARETERDRTPVGRHTEREHRVADHSNQLAAHISQSCVSTARLCLLWRRSGQDEEYVPDRHISLLYFLIFYSNTTIEKGASSQDAASCGRFFTTRSLSSSLSSRITLR
ncbi:hypothetical protein BLNAU_6994 [Blattamonas nauphoetae]|uniref:Uncharacterized protein n=1 Tax=Blattamonas nauphoetae TaxID=2049346 RepID=A0ABQ9Y2U1_9EUKA|nr:hypothetical protein BLNAU_6994 [Blattamonas nauphoetae]